MSLDAWLQARPAALSPAASLLASDRADTHVHIVLLNTYLTGRAHFPQHISALTVISDGSATNDVTVVREPDNAYDPNSCVVIHESRVLGHLAASDAALLAPMIDAECVVLRAHLKRTDAKMGLLVPSAPLPLSVNIRFTTASAWLAYSQVDTVQPIECGVADGPPVCATVQTAIKSLACVIRDGGSGVVSAAFAKRVAQPRAAQRRMQPDRAQSSAPDGFITARAVLAKGPSTSINEPLTVRPMVAAQEHRLAVAAAAARGVKAAARIERDLAAKRDRTAAGFTQTTLTDPVVAFARARSCGALTAPQTGASQWSRIPVQLLRRICYAEFGCALGAADMQTARSVCRAWRDVIDLEFDGRGHFMPSRAAWLRLTSRSQFVAIQAADEPASHGDTPLTNDVNADDTAHGLLHTLLRALRSPLHRGMPPTASPPLGVTAALMIVAAAMPPRIADKVSVAVQHGGLLESTACAKCDPVDATSSASSSNGWDVVAITLLVAPPSGRRALVHALLSGCTWHIVGTPATRLDAADYLYAFVNCLSKPQLSRAAVDVLVALREHENALLPPFATPSDTEARATFVELNRKTSLTDEQLAIVQATPQVGSVLRVLAFAGTGKTTALIAYAAARPSARMLYVVFNVSVRNDAGTRFPSNVVATNVHRLAYAAVGWRYDRARALRADMHAADVAVILDDELASIPIDGTDATSSADSSNASRLDLAAAVLRTMSSFFASADPELRESHAVEAAAQAGASPANVLKLSRALWMRMKASCGSNVQCSGGGTGGYYNSPVPVGEAEAGGAFMTHAAYLKLYCLSSPRLADKYDTLLVDEAQDLSPAVAALLLSQNCPILLVGDPYQALYGFAGAENALSRKVIDSVLASHSNRHATVDTIENLLPSATSGIIPAPPHVMTLRLMRAFRFGPQIAAVASLLLRLCGELEPVLGCRLAEHGVDAFNHHSLASVTSETSPAQNGSAEAAAVVMAPLGSGAECANGSIAKDNPLRRFFERGSTSLGDPPHTLQPSRDATRVTAAFRRVSLPLVAASGIRAIHATARARVACIGKFVPPRAAEPRTAVITAAPADKVAKDSARTACSSGGDHAAVPVKTVAYLARTQAGVVRAAATLAAGGARIAFVGGDDGYGLDILEDLCALATSQQAEGDTGVLPASRNIRSPLLRNFRTFDEVETFAARSGDAEMRSRVKLVASAGVERIVSAVAAIRKAVSASRDRDATGSANSVAVDVWLSTVHRAKGLEWDEIVLADDFPVVSAEARAEIHVLYVAVTRARRRVWANGALTHFLLRSGGWLDAGLAHSSDHDRVGHIRHANSTASSLCTSCGAEMCERVHQTASHPADTMPRPLDMSMVRGLDGFFGNSEDATAPVTACSRCLPTVVAEAAHAIRDACIRGALSASAGDTV